MDRFKKAFLPVFVFARIDIKRLFRDKVAIFFVFAFPLIFLAVFGGLFGGDDNISFKIGFVNQSDSSFARDFAADIKKNEIFNINKDVKSISDAEEKMNRGEIDATIILPPTFGDQAAGRDYPSGQARVLYDQNNEQAGRSLSAVLEQTFVGINAKFVQNETPFSVKAESTATKGLSQFDFTFSGLLGFTILSLGIFGPSSVFPKLKTRGVLRRYHTTTLKVWQYFLGNVLSNSVAALLSVVGMFVVALNFFDLSMRGDYASLAVMIVLGTAVIFGIGLALGGWAKNENQAAPLAQLISFPMMFLSGAFFPRFLMPEWLQAISGFLPLTPLVDGVRLIVTEGKTLLDLGPQIGLLTLWGIAIYSLAFRIFRWE